MRGTTRPSSMWRGLWVVTALALMPAAGCGGGDEEEAAPSRRVGRGGVVTSSAPAAPAAPVAAPAAASPTPRRAPVDDGSWRTIGRAADPAPVVAEPAAPAPEEAAAPVERDLSAELSGAFGSPTSCFDFGRISTFGDSLRIDVSITVMPSGRVNRATASGPGLNDAERTCLEERAMAVSLRGPIEGAPRTISTRIEYEIETRPAPTE